MTLKFSSKARNLRLLSDKIRTAQIAPLFEFSVGDWFSKKTSILLKIKSELGKGPWIVRSSCAKEDTTSGSNAGAYLTLLGINSESLEDAIERVITSYGDFSQDDEVLIQPMLLDVVLSGVGFSHDPNTCAPYRVISWNEGSDTTLVTGGQGGQTWQSAAQTPFATPPEIKGVMQLLEELIGLFEGAPIDFEFAVTKKGAIETLWLLQVRPLILLEQAQDEEKQTHSLQIISKKIERGMGKHPFLIGKRTIYGVMPDWNPAEIIGVRPKPLSLSLYRELVTDSIWAYQRNNYGYRNLRSFPLMPHFFGLPYIDVRLSFNSFIPADLGENLAGRLVDYYMNRLLQEPKLHDKVEFEIVFSCYTFDLPQRLEQLRMFGFSDSEVLTITNSLRLLTNRIVHPKNGLWREDAAKIEVLNERREQLLRSNADPLERIYWLLEDAKRYGTLPFAGLARAGFIAIQILKSLVSVGVFSENDYHSFIESISTISGQLNRDRSILDKSTFLSRYGHLRPGTYDLLSPRYDEAPELYFDWDKPTSHQKNDKPFSVTLEQMNDISKLMKRHGLDPDVVGLFEFLQAGIELRELAKFHFTRNLSDALSLIREFGKTWGFSPEDMAFCSISILKELHVSASDPSKMLARSIEEGKELHRTTKSIALPPIITQVEDVWGFKWPETSPNFITQKQITAKVVTTLEKEKLNGAIVCISNADPGFDWLFSYPIAGLITAWGGANSHMAIRAGELGLPAIIGAGEVLFRKWSHARKLHIDCAGRRVEILT